MIAIVAALLLLITTLAVWFVAAGARPAARLQIRFAGVLFAALSLSAATAAAVTVTLLVLPIGLSVLALAAAAGFARPVPASVAALLLALICLSGLTAAITGLAVFCLAPAAAAALAMAVLFARQFDAARIASVQGMASALCFLGAASSFAVDGAGAGLLLFSAAGLLGLAVALSRSDVVVEERAVRDLRGLAAIGRRRI
ncbi:MAG TPA: hypothetical protein VII56_20155 [Rhizomicrobium sp.]